MSGFRDLFALLLGWKSGTQPIAGPYRVVAMQGFSAGMVAGQAASSGAASAQGFSSGAVAAQSWNG